MKEIGFVCQTLGLAAKNWIRICVRSKLGCVCVRTTVRIRNHATVCGLLGFLLYVFVTILLSSTIGAAGDDNSLDHQCVTCCSYYCSTVETAAFGRNRIQSFELVTHSGRESGTCQLSPNSLVLAAGVLSGFKLSSLLSPL